jgi:hypothetical protein
MATFKIPLSTTPQTFEITLAGKDYLMTSKFCSADEGGWQLDINDAVTGAAIVAGLAVVTGTDILAGLDYLGFQGVLFAYTDGDQNAPPTFDNLGTESNVYFDTEVVDG